MIGSGNTTGIPLRRVTLRPAVLTSLLLALLLNCLPGQAQESATSDAQQTPIQLEATIRGNREQPNVLSIVPWQPPSQKQSLPPSIEQRMARTFTPLQRDEFQRRIAHAEKLYMQ